MFPWQQDAFLTVRWKSGSEGSFHSVVVPSTVLVRSMHSRTEVHQPPPWMGGDTGIWSLVSLRHRWSVPVQQSSWCRGRVHPTGMQGDLTLARRKA